VRGFLFNTFDLVASPSSEEAFPMNDHEFKTGDFGVHPEYPGWIWKLVRPHNNPRVGMWRLMFRLPGAKWPRNYDAPKIGEQRELGYSTLDKLNEMQVIALAASSE